MFFEEYYLLDITENKLKPWFYVFKDFLSQITVVMFALLLCIYIWYAEYIWTKFRKTSVIYWNWF